MHLLPSCKQATQLISERPLCQRVWIEDKHLRARRALPTGAEWDQNYTQTHALALSEPERKASCWVNKENRQRMRVREHKQNTAKLLFAFHISWTRSIPATLAVCSSNTKLFIATTIIICHDANVCFTVGNHYTKRKLYALFLPIFWKVLMKRLTSKVVTACISLYEECYQHYIMSGYITTHSMHLR